MLAGIPGMYGLGGGPGAASAFGVYLPARVDRDVVPQYVHVLGGVTHEVASTHPGPRPSPPDTDASDRDEAGASESDTAGSAGDDAGSGGPGVAVTGGTGSGRTGRVPLGRVIGTRSGDKGGNANLGVFTRSEDAWTWIDGFLTVERLADLLPETAALRIDRHRFPRIRALNFVVHDLLQEGVAASTRQDAQAKALGEWLRARIVDVPVDLI